MSKFENRRQEMIKSQMAARGLDDPILLEAINSVPREEFVPEDLIDSAYRVHPCQLRQIRPFRSPILLP